MGINEDMDHYMRDRKRRANAYATGTENRSWWSSVFAPKRPPLDDGFTHEEIVKVTAMEQDIKKGEERLEAAEPPAKEEIVEQQERRVGLYERFLGMFRVERKMEEDYESIDGEQLHGAAETPAPDVTEDFKRLAQIQLKWFDRLPTRIKEEFKGSDDYSQYREILERRNVVKK